MPKINKSRRDFIARSAALSLASLTFASSCSTKIIRLPKGAIAQGFTRSPFTAKSTAEEVTMGLDLSKQTILVTGANSGLGYETMRVLAMRGAHVIAAARTIEKANKAAKSVPGHVTGVACELTDFNSVVACAKQTQKLSHGKPLDALICNAGIIGGSNLQTVLGLEKQFVVNYLGHFLLTQRLLPQLKAAPQGRIVMISSGLYTKAPAAGIEFDNLDGHKSYSRFTAYGQSKLAMALFAAEFSRRHSTGNVTANSLYPGVIKTNLFREMPWYVKTGLSVGGWAFMKSVEQGTATHCYVATNPALKKINGLLFADCNPVIPNGPHLVDSTLSRKLWTRSLELTKKYL